MEQTLSVVRRSIKRGRPLGNVTIEDLIKTHVFIPWGNYEWRHRHVEALRRIGFRFGYMEIPEHKNVRVGLGFYSEELLKMLTDQSLTLIEIAPPLELKI